MCSTPKRTGVLFRATRVEEVDADYTSMLRRASARADRIQREREEQREREQPIHEAVQSESDNAQEPTSLRPSLRSRVWGYLNKPHYLFH